MNDARASGRGAWGAGATGRRGALPVVALVVAGGLQLLVGFYTLATGLLAPLWAIVALAVVWLLFVLLLVRVGRIRPLAAPLVPIANAAVLWAALVAGEVLLGWTP